MFSCILIGAVCEKNGISTCTLLAFSTIFAEAHCIAVGKAEIVEIQTVKAPVMISHFDVDLVYAYAPGGYKGIVIVNFTRIPNQTIPTDGVSDVYKVELSSNGHVIGSNVIGCTIGAGPSLDYMMRLCMSLGHLELRSESESAPHTWTIYCDPFNPSLVEPISLRVSRMGWIVVDGNSTYNNLNGNEAVQQVRLEKFQNGYLYNTFFPPENLSQIDLLNPRAPSNLTILQFGPQPTWSLSQQSPSPTQESVSSPQSAPLLSTTLAVASVVLVALAGTAVFVYFRKRWFRPEVASQAC